MQTLEYGHLSPPQQYPHAVVLAEPRSPGHAFRKNQLPIVPHLLCLPEKENLLNKSLVKIW